MQKKTVLTFFFSFDIFYKISSWNMILISNDFCHKTKKYHFEPHNVLLAIATNIPVLLLTVLCSRDTYVIILRSQVIAYGSV